MATPEKPARENFKSTLCFVVGPIGKDGSTERKHADLLLHAVIKHVLENEEFGYKVKRADQDADPGMIGDRVIADVINSSLVVADLTDLNPNAFYELGIRHSTELPTIHMAKSGTTLPFDNVAHRTIFVDLGDWHSIEQARTSLANSARAIRATDYRVSNPITQANASFKMRQSDDPRDQSLALIQERLELLENRATRTEGTDQSFHLSPKDQEAIDRLKSLATFAETLASLGKTPSQIESDIRKKAQIIGLQLFDAKVDKKGELVLRDNKGYGFTTGIGKIKAFD